MSRASTERLVHLGSAGTLPEVLTARSAEVAEAVTRAVAIHIVLSSPEWLALEHQRQESEAFRKHMVERILELAVTGEPFSVDDLRFYESLGGQFARHGVPLPVLTAAFDVGTTAITGESWRLVPAGHFAEMAQFTGFAAQMMEQAQQVSVSAYLEASRAGGGPGLAREALAEALIAGEPALSAAKAPGERLAPGYLAMACVAGSPAHADALRKAAAASAAESVAGTLCGRYQSRVVVLFAVQDSRQKAEAAAADLAARLRKMTGQQVYAAHAYRPGIPGIPAAVDEACSALSLAMASPGADRPLYRMDDLLVELAISRQSDIRQRLAGLLSPLEAGADLQHTLEVLFSCNLDRERAARELCIHRRTLRYRVDRIRELSGIDPDSVRGLQLLRAALTATRLPAGEPHHAREETDRTAPSREA